MDSTLDPFARAMEARLRRRMFESSCPQVKIGRFFVDMPIGQGGMGVVYAARDEQLDRTIALKLVHAESRPSDHAQLRLLREAQAMARLSHPNVVQVFEAGAHEDQVFIAMEYVRGETLDRWLRREARGWRETVAIFCQAGRGLAAAHKLGIVHRDFKPTNVLVGEDGRARVTDFGLARHVDVREPESAEPPRRVLDVALTLTDAEPGTPFYMSPEQFKRERVSERSDQFSFCVALYHALFGMRPFAGETRHALVAAVTSGALRTPPRGRVPWRVHNAVLRGLSLDPESRFPDMDTLLVELATRTRVGVVLPVAFALDAAAAVANSFSSAEPPCTDGATHLEDIWDDETRDELEREFLRGAPGSGAALWTSTEEQLSRYLSDWRAAYRDNCEVHRAGKTSARLRDLRARCLEQRLDVIRGITRVLRDGDVATLLRAPQAAAKLEDLTVCSSSRSLPLGVEPPPLGHVEEVADLRDELARARSEELLGQLESGRERARRALERAEALAYTPLVAEAQLAVGALRSKLGRYDEAEATLEAAYFTAAEHQLAELEVNAAGQLTVVTGYALTRPADGERWARLAEVGLRRLGEDDPLLEAGRLNSLAMVRQAAGDFESSTRLFEAALGRARQALGDDHPKVAQTLNNLAVAQRSRGDFAAAEAINREVLGALEAGLGPEHPDFATAVNNLADTLAQRGERAEATALYRRALTIRELALGPEHPHVAQTLIGLGATLHASGENTQAELALGRGLAIFEAALGGEHPDVAYALTHLAEVELALAEVDRAAEHFTRSRDLFERTLGPDHHYLALPLIGLADVALARDEATAAIPPAERALALVADVGGAPKARADARFALARALAAAGSDPARADSLAAAAKTDYRELGAAGGDGLAAIERWLDTRAAGSGDEAPPTREGPP
ncbi:MAG: serine/threonine protein kinase [Myxococcales bacterium]|nr:serine/threonine protein kinase [Myxococcales bacterium]